MLELRTIFALFLTLSLVACGGGGGSGNTAHMVRPPMGQTDQTQKPIENTDTEPEEEMVTPPVDNPVDNNPVEDVMKPVVDPIDEHRPEFPERSDLTNLSPLPFDMKTLGDWLTLGMGGAGHEFYLVNASDGIGFRTSFEPGIVPRCNPDCITVGFSTETTAWYGNVKGYAEKDAEYNRFTGTVFVQFFPMVNDNHKMGTIFSDMDIQGKSHTPEAFVVSMNVVTSQFSNYGVGGVHITGWVVADCGTMTSVACAPEIEKLNRPIGVIGGVNFNSGGYDINGVFKTGYQDVQ